MLRAFFRAAFVSLVVASSFHLRADGLLALSGHDGRGRLFDISWLRGEVVAITFASRYTREQAARVNEALLRHMAHGDSEVVTIVNLVGVPKIAYGYVRKRVAQADQEGRIRHLIDDGQLSHRFQVKPEREVNILIVDRQGVLRGRYAGERQLQQALELVDELKSKSASAE